MGYYPAFLKIQGWPSVVIGPGDELEQRTLELLEAGAQVTVLSPSLPEALRRMAAEGVLRWIPRRFQAGDLAGFRLAVDVRRDRRGHTEALEEARRLRVLYRAVDDPAGSDFIAGATLRRGPLIIAVSTSGHAPALAVRLRDRLGAMLGEEYGVFLELLGTLRGEIAHRIPRFEDRRALWHCLVNSEALDRIRRGDVAGARGILQALVEEAEGSRSPNPEGTR